MNNQPNEPDPQAEAIDLLTEAHFRSSPEELQPSSGFAQSVMQLIRAEAVEPPPIAFPWRRIVPGAIAILCSLLAVAIHFIRYGIPRAPASAFHLPDIAAAIFSSPKETALSWILAAFCLAAAAIATSFHLTGRRE